MNRQPETRVACLCCRKAVATAIVKDNGLKTYPACKACIKSLHRPTVVRRLS